MEDTFVDPITEISRLISKDTVFVLSTLVSELRELFSSLVFKFTEVEIAIDIVSGSDLKSPIISCLSLMDLICKIVFRINIDVLV
jgi:hypothetical protein